MLKVKSEDWIVMGVASSAIAIFSLVVLGFSGMRTLLAIFVAVLVPFYFIFDNFDLSSSEKALFSFFSGLVIFPSLVYWMGFIMPFRIAIIASFSLILTCGYAHKKWMKTRRSLSTAAS